MTATSQDTAMYSPRPAPTAETDPDATARWPAAAARENGLTEVFVSIAESLAVGYDLMDLYSGLTADCARILDVGSAGLVLADAGGVLHVMAASSERARDLECFQVQCAEGPCLDSYRTGTAVLVPDLAAARTQWPTFATVAVEAGFASVHAIPMRLQGTVLGSLNLFDTRSGPLNGPDLRLAQAFAHVASLALVAGKAAADSAALAGQLQTALDSRVVLEQAKGIVSEFGRVDVDDAFKALRRYSRDNNLPLSALAAAVVRRALPADLVLTHACAKGILTPAAH